MMWPLRGRKSDLPDGGSGDSSSVAISYIRHRAHLLLHPLHWARRCPCRTPAGHVSGQSTTIPLRIQRDGALENSCHVDFHSLAISVSAEQPVPPCEYAAAIASTRPERHLSGGKATNMAGVRREFTKSTSRVSGVGHIRRASALPTLRLSLPHCHT